MRLRVSVCARIVGFKNLIQSSAAITQPPYFSSFLNTTYKNLHKFSLISCILCSVFKVHNLFLYLIRFYHIIIIIIIFCLLSRLFFFSLLTLTLLTNLLTKDRQLKFQLFTEHLQTKTK